MRGYPYSSAFAGDITAFIEFKASVGIAEVDRDVTRALAGGAGLGMRGLDGT